ncbi:methyl-accepting chemotaxis protein [Pseudorhodoferax sp.]|uniref:methyl-accepting chemotaxis protein n=1 Tax=Pseudorhodoferax sp. TaxID=1993553 RepID=UPI002DD68907|nr:methyl-accepting chemotaxis protein [Pseudorhodoferax sp.]
MSLSQLRISTRLWLAIGLLIGTLVLLIGFAAVRSAHSQAVADQLLTDAETKIRLATRWAGLTELAVTRVHASAIGSDPAVAQAFKPLIDKAIADINEVQKALQAFPASSEEQALQAQIAEQRQQVLASNARIVKARAAGDGAAARQEADTVFAQATVRYLDSLRSYVVLNEKAGAAVRQRVADERRATIVAAGSVVLLIIIGTLVGTVALIRSIREPVNEAVELAGAIAGGDLSPRTIAPRGDELGDLNKALLAMLEALRRTVSEVHTVSDGIRTASSEIAVGNQDLSDRTEQTASNLQQTAASMQQLTGTVRQSADSAQHANRLVSDAAAVAARGGDVVSQVVATMEEINNSSRRIADIIGTIDGIAFQTNILALNAAVEAARAGEEGRGFAVVAGEVRNLAQRSAEAAREIKQLIGSSVERVDAGSRLVGDAGTTMQEIVSSVKQVSDMMAEISAAASEQSTGIVQVSNAVGQLDHMTQQNAALVEQSAAAAASLSEQAQRLSAAVEVFRLGGR